VRNMGGLCCRTSSNTTDPLRGQIPVAAKPDLIFTTVMEISLAFSYASMKRCFDAGDSSDAINANRIWFRYATFSGAKTATSSG
jgi:hypothetical protein